MVNIVNYEQAIGINGILTKYATKMHEELLKMGIECQISSQPNGSSINHHINYRSYKPSGQIDTLMVTHVWEGDKMDSLRQGMKTAKLGICFSKETEDKLKHLGPMATVLPAHDNVERRKKLVYIPTNVYPDNCKREQLFANLHAPDFYFIIMGKGWESLLKDTKLEHSYIPQFDYTAHHEILKRADYCLYFGLDEGSMGILDATQAGVKTIAPLQGFHHEIGINYPFDTEEELQKIFDKLAYNPVSHLTWEKYTAEHLKLWQNLL
jgi:hypothetical protein